LQKRSIIVRSLLIVATPYPEMPPSKQLQVSFAEYSLFYRALLQKRSIIVRSLLIVAGNATIKAIAGVNVRVEKRPTKETYKRGLYKKHKHLHTFVTKKNYK